MLRVLVIDSSVTFLTAIAGRLGALPGVQLIATCQIGSEGIQIARQTRPDFAVVDLHGAPSAGLDTARQLRQLLPDSTIVLVSFDPEQLMQARQNTSGADCFIEKGELFLQLPCLLRQADPMPVQPS